MPRSELAGMFEMLRTAPQPASIAEMRTNMEVFIPFVNANAPQVARVDAGVVVADGVSADILIPPGTPPFPTLIYQGPETSDQSSVRSVRDDEQSGDWRR